MLYKFCGFYVKMSPLYESNRSMAEKFRYYGTVPINAELIILNNYSESYLKRCQAMEYYSKLPLNKIEFILLAADFHTKILDYKAVMIHSSAVKYKGECCLFAAPSGFGKSTHTGMWKRLFDAEIINDDSPVIRLIDGKPVAYGSPFAGGTLICEDTSAELKAIVFLERAFENSIRELNSRESVKRLLMCTLRVADKEKMNSLMETLNTLCAKTKFYLLSCNQEDQAAVMAEKYIFKENCHEN